ncbi:hypothetical protein PENSPDRAFT_663820 [Peniophora sp. CONT]|nr:hypothetical protein PENSPDRAFT_663820 [Peniophora sp. CONT]
MLSRSLFIRKVGGLPLFSGDPGDSATLDLPITEFQMPAIELSVQREYSSSTGQKERFWKLYFDSIADRSDKQRLESWKGDTDGILIFTGLFGAIVATFAVDSLPMLSASSTERTTAIVWVNALWFIALFLALCCGLLATRVQQWALRYVHESSRRGSRDRRGPLHLIGLQRFGLSAAIEAISMLLHTAVFLFCSGLLIALFTSDAIVAWAVTALVAAGSMLYLLLSILSYQLSEEDSFERVSISSAVRTVYSLLSGGRTPLKDTLDWNGLCAALQLLISTIDDPREAELFFDVICPMISSDASKSWRPAGADVTPAQIVDFLVTGTSCINELNRLVASCTFHESRTLNEEQCNRRLQLAYSFWHTVLWTLPHDRPSIIQNHVFLMLRREYEVIGDGRPIPPLTESRVFSANHSGFAYNSTGLVARCNANLMRKEEYAFMKSWTGGWKPESISKLFPGYDANSSWARTLGSPSVKDGQSLLPVAGLPPVNVLRASEKYWKPAFDELIRAVNLPERRNHELDYFPTWPAEMASAHTAFRRVFQLMHRLQLLATMQSDVPAKLYKVVNLNEQYKPVLTHFPDLDNCLHDFIAWFNRSIPSGMSMDNVKRALLGADYLREDAGWSRWGAHSLSLPVLPPNNSVDSRRKAMPMGGTDSRYCGNR